MGLCYRKSYKFGPFRITFSKSGVSYSFGFPGFRITKRANGKLMLTLGIPGTGVYYRKQYK